MSKILHRSVVPMAFLLFFVSCKTRNNVTKRAAENKTSDEVLAEMKKNEYQFQTLSGKASVAIESKGKKNSLKATIRMRKDSAIWINFSYIGFAGARVLITQDSVKLINYKDSKYLLTDLDYINNLFNIDADFETIQSLLLGNSASFDEDGKLRTAAENNEYFLSSMRKRRLQKGKPIRGLDKLERKQEKNPERIRYTKKQERKEEKFGDDVYSIWMDASNSKIVRTLIQDFFNDVELRAKYSDFRDTEGQLFPFKVDFNVRAKDTSNISVEYIKMTRNKPVKFSFNIPTKYERIAN